MSIDVMTAVAGAVGTLLAGMATAWVAIKSANVTVADKLLQAMKEEAALLSQLPETSSAHRRLQTHLDWMTQRYIPERSAQVDRKVHWPTITGVLIAGAVEMGLTIWVALLGGWALLWLAVLVPMLLVWVYGFFYEIGGGDARALRRRQR
ncbi:hypothetical protein [Streptomyces sp. NPDC048277]|uniref:hypothetical protein n=1 Tax=Streptomyces sp. NPDC048277 TaxID=3155027 RepID=UPI0033C619E6